MGGYSDKFIKMTDPKRFEQNSLANMASTDWKGYINHPSNQPSQFNFGEIDYTNLSGQPKLNIPESAYDNGFSGTPTKDNQMLGLAQAAGQRGETFQGFMNTVDPETAQRIGALGVEVGSNGEIVIPNSGSGMSDMEMGQLGLAGVQTLLGGIGAYKNYGLQKKALNSQLADAKMQRGLAAENYINQQGVRSSLAGAFGGSSSAYDDALSKYGKYQEKE